MPSHFSLWARGVATNTTSDVEIIAAPGVRSFINIDCIVIANCDSAGSAHPRIYLKENSTTKWGPFHIDDTTVSIPLPRPIRLAENAALKFSCDASVDSIAVSVAYHIDPEG